MIRAWLQILPFGRSHQNPGNRREERENRNIISLLRNYRFFATTFIIISARDHPINYAPLTGVRGRPRRLQQSIALCAATRKEIILFTHSVGCLLHSLLMQHLSAHGANLSAHAHLIASDPAAARDQVLYVEVPATWPAHSLMSWSPIKRPYVALAAFYWRYPPSRQAVTLEE